MQVVEIDGEATHPLRRQVLREGRPEAEVAFPEDQVAGAFHLGVVDEAGALLAVGTFSPEPTPHRPGARAFRLRGLAVEPSHQGRGLGRMLLDAAVERLRAAGVQVLWGNGRDATLDFYRRLGWQVVGEGFVTDIGLPHHVVLIEL